MQNNVLCAFRKRLKNFGYADVHIYHLVDDVYTVVAVEPLGGNLIAVDYTVTQMHNALHVRTISKYGDRLSWRIPSPANALTNYERCQMVCYDKPIECYYIF